MINIEIRVPIVHGQNPYEDVLDAINALKRHVEAATPGDTRLRGTLQNMDGRYVAHYLITFGERQR